MKTELKNINWNNVITYNPQFGLDLTGNLPQGGIEIPAYGDFGGPQNTKPIDDPEKIVGVDALDTLFGHHDHELSKLLEDGAISPVEVEGFILAHVNLITEVAKLPKDSSGLLIVDGGGSGNAEATLYAGLTVLALTNDLAHIPGDFGLTVLDSKLDFSNLPDTPAFDNVLNVVTQAVENMETGFAELPGAGKSLHGAAAYFEKELVHLLTPSDTPDFV
jgi:hypothetical protein